MSAFTYVSASLLEANLATNHSAESFIWMNDMDVFVNNEIIS